MRFIRLTSLIGDSVLVNVDQIVEVYRNIEEEHTVIRYNGEEESFVNESIDDVEKLIAMERRRG